jgi:hypothetical protein
MLVPVNVSLSSEYMASISSRRPRTSQAIKAGMLESFVRNWFFVLEDLKILEGVAGVAHDASALERIGI